MRNTLAATWLGIAAGLAVLISVACCSKTTPLPAQCPSISATSSSTAGVSPPSENDRVTLHSSANGDSTTSSSNPQWVLGYYAGYQMSDYPIESIDWSSITHIALASLLVKADLALNFEFFNSHSDVEGKAFARQLSSAARKHNVKSLLMLGGADSGVTIAEAATSVRRRSFVKSLLDAVSSLGFDGLDLDWEDKVHYPDFVELVKAIRAASPDSILSVPVAPVSKPAEINPLVPVLAQSLDRLNVMTYGGWAMAGVGYCWCSWHSGALGGAFSDLNSAQCSAPRAIDQNLGAYASVGVPKSKLGMGIAFSALCYLGSPPITEPGQTTDPGDPTCSRGGPYAFGGGDNNYPLAKFFEGGGTFSKYAAARRRDASAQVPYLSLPKSVVDVHCGGSTRYISYDDEESIVAKGHYSRQNGFGGTIVWTLAQGWLPPGAVEGRPQNSLMQALKTGFLDP
jgi:chitinase